MNWFKRLKSQLFYKYLLSYLGVFLIPFMLMSIIVYHHNVNGLRKEIEQSNIMKLKQAENITSERLRELEGITARISLDFRLTPYMIDHDFYGIQAINELKKYKANHSMIKELFIYYSGGNKVYSSSGRYSLDSLLGKRYQFQNLNIQDFVHDLQTNQTKVIPVSNVITNRNILERLMVVFYPLAPKNRVNTGTLVYFIEENTLTNFIRNIHGNFQGNTYIFGEDDQLIASSENAKSLHKEDLFVKVNEGGIDHLILNNEEYSVVSVKSDYNHWTYVTVINADQFFGQIFEKKKFIMILLSSLFLFGIAISIFLAKNQYNPIKGLFEYTRDNEKDIDKQDLNELEQIYETISNVAEVKQSLSKTLDLQKPYARDRILLNLLRGDYQSNEQLEEILKKFNIEMYNEGCFVGIVYFKENAYTEKDMEDREQLTEALSNLKFNKALLHVVDLLYNDALALIVSIDKIDGDVYSYRNRLIHKIRDRIQNYTKLYSTIGVGNLYESKKYINRSFIEALATTNYKIALKEGNILYYDELKPIAPKNLGYQQDEQVKLVHSLKQGDEIVAKETIENIFENLQQQKTQTPKMRLVYFDIINSILKTADELDFTSQIGDLKEIIHFESVNDLENKLIDISMTICQKNELKRENEIEFLRNEITNYLQKKYTSYDLSLESLAQQFQFSVPYLSKFIKEQMGSTFTEYVFKLRLEEVKRQLIETNKLIGEIVQDVGYQDASNFIRKFKRIEGITPGEYRRIKTG